MLKNKNGNVKQRQNCAKSFDEQIMIPQLIEQEAERVKNILEKGRGQVCKYV